MCWRLQPCVLEAAAPCAGGCNPMCWRLQLHVLEAAAPCVAGCRSSTASMASGPSISAAAWPKRRLGGAIARHPGRATMRGLRCGCVCGPAQISRAEIGEIAPTPRPRVRRRDYQRYLPLGLLPPPRCALEAAHVLYAALHDASTSLAQSELGGAWPEEPRYHDTIGRADDPALARHAAVVRASLDAPATPRTQPCSPAALQPCSPAALQPCSPAAMQPCSPAALQPRAPQPATPRAPA